MSLAIVTNGYMPVPATRGGAVESLVDNFIEENERKKELNITVFSAYDKKAIELSKTYKYTSVIFFRPNIIIKLLDRTIYFIAKNILRKERTQSYRYIIQRLDFLRKVSKNLKKNNYSKVLIENHPTLFMCLKKYDNYKKYKGKYYYHIHNEIVNDFGNRELIKNSKNNICVSNFVANQSQDFLEIDSSNYTVLKNGIETDRFSKVLSDDQKSRKRQNLGLGDDDIILLYTGRYTREKGIISLLRSFQKINNPKVKLILAGGTFFNTKIKNNDAVEIENLIEKMSDKIVNLGFVDYKEIETLYQISDISVQPSICNDSAPLTIIESLVSGLPIITTYSGGIPEYVDDTCAIILEPDESLENELCKSIEYLAKDRKLRKRMSENSRNKSKELTVSNYYNNFIKILNDKEG